MNVKQVRRVRRQRPPGYPTRPEVARDPELLRRHVPSAWRKSAQVTAALSIMLASAYAQDPPVKGKALKIAPIFEHGEGYGSEGCIIMNPPRFLAEEEAQRIIAQELKEAGIPAPERKKTLPELEVATFGTGVIETRDPKDGKIWDTSEGVENGRAPLVLDFFESQKRIAIVYVSKDDKNLPLSGDIRSSGGLKSSVTERLFVKAAEWVRQEIIKNDQAPEAYYGILYDPCPQYQEPDWTKIPPGPDHAKRCKEAIDALNPDPAGLLRAQVKDFIEWLKGQGAI